eukprot:XP_019077418.1 PREDICTED: uncharacterized protein LOC100243041 isoform X2 [Vitis vinifera]
MESSAADRSHHRVPLSEVVSDCVKRWFQDTLREAKSGDVSMQVLVGQMYYSGYGVPRDAQKIVGFVVLENFVFCPLPEKPREKKNEILNLIFHLGRVWMTRASRTRSSVWKVSDKHPGAAWSLPVCPLQMCL